MKLQNVKQFFLLLFTGVSLVACQKEVNFQNEGSQGNGNGNGTNNINIKGDWTFTGANAKTYAAITITEGTETLKSITTSDYDTQENTGSLTITDKQFIFTGIGHKVSDIAHSVTYYNGDLFDETDMPFEAVTPPTDNTSPYVRNTNDSVTLTTSLGMLPDPSGGLTPTPAGPLGMKISISGDVLTLVMKTAFSNTITQAGIPAFFDAKLESIMKFKRK